MLYEAQPIHLPREMKTNEEMRNSNVAQIYLNMHYTWKPKKIRCSRWTRNTKSRLGREETSDEHDKQSRSYLLSACIQFLQQAVLVTNAYLPEQDRGINSKQGKDEEWNRWNLPTVELHKAIPCGLQVLT